jgi:hypothetical protein
MSTARPKSWWPRLIAAMLCVIAIAAALIAALTRSWPNDAPRTTDPVAPGLAARSDQQLAELLPKLGEFPASWTVKSRTMSDRFGYFRQQPFHERLGASPAECANLGELATGALGGAEVSGYDRAGRPSLRYEPRDIRLTVAREFNLDGFDAMIPRVFRCSRFTFAQTIIHTVRVLEDSRPASGPQRFRISVTIRSSDEPPSVMRTEYFSYARLSRLILVGFASTGNQQLLDALFDNTLRRIGSS